ncbi:MAG: ferredoxin reductase family protein [Candidatus Nanopelagicales bacterium]
MSSSTLDRPAAVPPVQPPAPSAGGAPPPRAPRSIARGTRGRSPQTSPHQPARAPHRATRWVADAAAWLAGIGLGVVLGIYAATRTATPDSWATALTETGRLTGLVGTYGVLLVLLLAARIPWLEREVGQDRLIRWHRLLAPWSLALIAAHVVLITAGYALTDRVGFAPEAWTLVSSYPWVLPALAGFVLMLVAGFSSYRRVRRRMTYETWWVTHLYTYLAVALAFAHQVVLGAPFVEHRWAQAVWIAMYAVTLGSLVAFRFALPLWRGARHDLRVAGVVRESADTVSVWVTGRGLDRMRVAGGQFFAWRFLTRQWWWQAHPYSLSASPDGRHLRITVKDLGDQSRELARLRPGTRVLAEGPYGAFTAGHRRSDRVVLVGGGVGITPIRAVLEDLPYDAPVDVLYRAPRPEAVVLHAELDALARARPRTRVRYLVGSRRQFPLDARSLTWLVPDLAAADVYVCGPDDLVTAVREATRVAGVPPERVHSEDFAFLPG